MSLLLWHHGTGGAVAIGPPHKFWAVRKLSENFFLSENSHPKMQNLGLKTPIIGKV